jgi:hypothetical protein
MYIMHINQDEKVTHSQDEKVTHSLLLIDLIWFIVFNATFSNISAISWWLVLVVEEAGVPAEKYRPWATNCF